MTINYPLALPSSPAPARFTINQTSFSALTQSPFSASQQVQALPGQLWSFSVEFPPMNDTQARDFFGTLAQLKGRYGTFLFGDPRWTAPRGDWGAAPLVNGPGQSGQTLAVSGLPGSAIVRAGDYFQTGSGATARLHMVTVDATANGSGEVTLDIWPRLRATPVDSSAIVTARPKGVFRLSSSNVARTWEPFRWGLNLEMVEAV